MAERKAVNKYYPSDWDPRKHGSINKYRKSHPLRERARKLDQGILVIRFEMPYNIWCEGCNNHIGMGVRYNAEKSKTGMYYSTPVYKFRMKCHLCDNHFEMQTDPQNLDYVILNGARRQENRWDPHENEQIVPEDKDTTKKLATDAMFRLEHAAEDKSKAKAAAPVIEELEKFQERWKDDYGANQLLRKQFRLEKKKSQDVEEKNKSFLQKKALSGSGIRLLPEDKTDIKLASLVRLESSQSYEEKEVAARRALLNQPVFGPTKRLGFSKGSTSVNQHLEKVINSVVLKKYSDLEKEKSLTVADLGIAHTKPKNLVPDYPSDSDDAQDGPPID